MKYGMSIEEYKLYVDGIKEDCEKLIALKEKKNSSEVYPAEIKQQVDNLWFTTSNFIDRSHGYILTDDENMTKDFETMFNHVRSFLRIRNSIAHFRAEIARALKENDDDKLIESAEFLKIERSIFNRCVDDLLKHATYVKDEYFGYSK